jgi:hypothetical protein
MRGYIAMAQSFADHVAGSEVRPEMVERLHVEFYAMLKMFYQDFKSMKLIPKK